MPNPTDPRAVADDPSGIVQQMPEVTTEALAGIMALFLTPEQARLKLMTGEAMRSAKRLIDHFFRNEGERPRVSIPAQPDYDDDLIVTDCLRYGAHICATEADLRAEVERLRGMIDSAANIFENCSVENGVCCCGDAMDNHSGLMHSNHVPVDQGAYVTDEWLKAYKSLYPETDGGQDA